MTATTTTKPLAHLHINADGSLGLRTHSGEWIPVDWPWVLASLSTDRVWAISYDTPRRPYAAVAYGSRAEQRRADRAEARARNGRR